MRNRSLAEDLVQDAYAQLWTHWASVTQPTAWLRRAAVANMQRAIWQTMSGRPLIG